MISSENLEATWNLLESYDLKSDELQIRETDRSVGHLAPPIFAIDANRCRHLLLPVQQGYQISEDKRSAGVQVSIHEFLDQGRIRYFVDVVCLKPHLNKLFSIIITDILRLIDDDELEPDIASGIVINNWRELLEQVPSGKPDINTLTGLYAELITLRRLAEFNPKSLSSWYGPQKARHDFTSRSAAIEVKGSRAREGRIVKIHGVEQLESPENADLYLAVVKLERVQQGGQSIGALINSITSLGVSTFELFKMISEIGITPDVVDKIENIHFKVREYRTYLVDNSFPRITRGTFTGSKLPPGVLGLTYEIDLTNEPPFPLGNEDEGAVFRKFAESVEQL